MFFRGAFLSLAPIRLTTSAAQAILDVLVSALTSPDATLQGEPAERSLGMVTVAAIG